MRILPGRKHDEPGGAPDADADSAAEAGREPPEKEEGRVVTTFVAVRDTVVYILRRFMGDGIPQLAASLSYNSLLALVPFLAIGFAILTAFPIFDAIQEDLQAMVFDSFVPHAGETVQAQVAKFAENARRASGIGVLALAVTALMLLANIETAMNRVWRAAETRSMMQRFLSYWAIVTLGPLLLGASMSLSGYVFALTQVEGVSVVTQPFLRLAVFLPILFSALGLSLIYVVVPNRLVRWRYALPGALVAALLFEGTKRLFALYLKAFPTYEAIYGALAAIPIFLVWMYVAWLIVLMGAEIAAGLSETVGDKAHARKEPPAPEEIEPDPPAS